MILTALVEVPRGGFRKREAGGSEEDSWISPLPAPFAYGCVPGLEAPDGDAADAVILGMQPEAGARVTLPVVAVVRFRDQGVSDPKWVLAPGPLPPGRMRALAAFFRFYALARRLLDILRGRRPSTRFEGVVPLDPGADALPGS
ncbi:MAG: hypothetical protein JXB39_01930 [Deltaproteobacteria bacterium]|nr:hypothetical protein [Deltaproteobacteria bacterium]